MKKKSIFKNGCFLAFFLSFLLGCIIVIPNIISGKGIYCLAADFNIQQIPFNKLMNYSLKNGSFLWTWYNDLGSNFLGTFSFYNLFSPFNMIGYVFPEKFFEYLIGPIFILKYGIAGLTSYLFFKRYVKNKNYALIGSLLYSFSGFQLTNILFYHFHDVVALFPLLVYTLDNLVYENKKGAFALSVALCAITNWFFFVGQVIFIIIYFLVKSFTKSYKMTLKKFGQVLFEGIIGSLIASFILLPSYFFTKENPRIGHNWNLISALKYDTSTYLEILRAPLFPNDNMRTRSFISSNNYSSVEAYLPLVGMTIVLAYILKKPKDWKAILFYITTIIMFIPILNSMFYLFNQSYYARWFYMPTLILALISIKGLEENIDIKKGSLLTILLYIVLLSTSYLYAGKLPIFRKYYFLGIIFFAILNLILINLIVKIKDEKRKVFLTILSIFVFISIFGNYTTFKYKVVNGDVYKDYITEKAFLKKYQNVRINGTTSCEFNLGYINKINYLKVFNSNINGSSFEFLANLGIPRSIYTSIPFENKNLINFLGIKYTFNCDNNDLSKYGYELDNKESYFTIYKNKEAKDLGFVPSNYMLIDDFDKISFEEKAEVLNEDVILTKEQIKKYADLFTDSNYEFRNEFIFQNNGFTDTIKTTKNSLVVYQVPYDKGWKAFVDGKKVPIEKVDHGLMAIKVTKGTKRIEFKYCPVGLKLGLIISILSLGILVCYMEKKLN